MEKDEKTPWIMVKDRLPEEGERVLAGFWYYYKYADREAESRKYVSIFMYKNGMWIDDEGDSYFGKKVECSDIEIVCWIPIPSF